MKDESEDVRHPAHVNVPAIMGAIMHHDFTAPGGIIFTEPSREAAEMRIERSLGAAAAFGNTPGALEEFGLSSSYATDAFRNFANYTWRGIPYEGTTEHKPRRPVTGDAKTKIIKARKAERQRKKRARTRNRK